MREALLPLLVEPQTGSPLELHVTRHERDQIIEGRLVSSSTGTQYRIEGGVPRFVAGQGYADSFGFQWNRFRTVQIDSDTGATLSKRRFEAEVGWKSEELQGKWVLDAGCGAGRFAEIVAACGPNLVAFDYSSAVDAATTALARFSNVDVVQGSLLEPPFIRGAFDFAYCIGVVQHTPSPETAITRLVDLVRKHGQFAMTMYARRPWTKFSGKYLVRPVTRRMKAETLLSLIEHLMPIAFPVADRLFRIPTIGGIARFAFPIAVYPESEREYSRDQRYREAVLDTFDMLSPMFDSPMTRAEVERLLGIANVSSWTFRSVVPINVVGCR